MVKKLEAILVLKERVEISICRRQSFSFFSSTNFNVQQLLFPRRTKSESNITTFEGCRRTFL
jgi:hypothetical protein